MLLTAKRYGGSLVTQLNERPSYWGILKNASSRMPEPPTPPALLRLWRHIKLFATLGHPFEISAACRTVSYSVLRLVLQCLIDQYCVLFGKKSVNYISTNARQIYFYRFYICPHSLTRTLATCSKLYVYALQLKSESNWTNRHVEIVLFTYTVETSMTRTYLGPIKFVLKMGSSSHW